MKFNFRSVLSLLLLCAIFSCEKQENVAPQDDLSINSAKAEAIAVAFFQDFKKTGSKPAIGNSQTLLGSDDEPYLHIFNIQGGGFVLVAADERVSEIIAFSEDGNFVMSPQLPIGILSWMETVQNKVELAREGKYSKDQEAQMYTTADSRIVYPGDGPVIGDDPIGGGSGDGGDCQVSTHVGPLLTTAWGQQFLFNSAFYREPILDSAKTDIVNGYPYTGCNATAIAQIMYFHSFPVTYPWSMMQERIDCSGRWNSFYEVSDLMYDIAKRMPSTKYYVKSTAARFDEVDDVLRGFGYNYARIVDLDGNDGALNTYHITSQLSNKRPVILSARPNSGAAGHTWVCDGYIRKQDKCSGASSLYLHMNWGWSDLSVDGCGPSLNGYYSWSNWNPQNLKDGGSFNYNYDREAVIDIWPVR